MLYHTDIYVPQAIRAQVRRTGKVAPIYSPHAIDQSVERKVVLPSVIDFTKCEPFEIETKRDGTIIKVGYRTRYQHAPKSDLIVIIHPSNNYVRTAWVNQTTDQHATLDISIYEKATPTILLGD